MGEWVVLGSLWVQVLGVRAGSCQQGRGWDAFGSLNPEQAGA